VSVVTARWVLPIDRPVMRGAWIEIRDGRIVSVGSGQPPEKPTDLGDVAVLPGLVNAHTHLELSWMAGHVPPAASMNEWIRMLLRVRRAGPAGGVQAEAEAARAAALTMRSTGTVAVGDISNTLISPRILANAGLAGVVFYELLGFNVADPGPIVSDALRRAADGEAALPERRAPLRTTIAAHAPYSVSPRLLREVARSAAGPLAIHLGESSEELEFLRSGAGPIRETLEELGVWNPAWEPPRSGPVEYLSTVGYLKAGLLAVHGVHLTDDELSRLRQAGATLVTCPRSNSWVGAGLPRVAHFYTAGVPVAVGTDSLASVSTLNMFDELTELRRVAPEIAAASLLESATRVGARALGLDREYGTLAPGRRAELVTVSVPARETDVEEYLVSGVPSDAVRPLSL
jgi:cytosine/adenosine deaminase-related metal-dependent hydrolase